jgi:Tfp pilus assembly protein PilX
MKRHSKDTRRRGIVSVVVLIVLMLITAMVAQYARRALGDRRQMRVEMQHQQAIQLAAAGLLRAKNKVAADAEFQTETWQLPAGVIHQTNTATVEITVQAGRVTVVARYPANKEHPIKVTKTADIGK